jgi:myo-inositol-1(or 4)-monophosphatase
MSIELNQLSALLRAVAREEIMPRWRKAVTTSKADGSLVTETDLAVQQRIVAALAETHPDVPVLGEEMDTEAQRALLYHTDNESAFWCLDPLDGTSNYACGFPAFGISLALVRGGRAELGLILDPVHDECFMAVRGEGAWRDGEPLRPFAPGNELKDCLAMVDMKRLPPARIAPLFTTGSFRSQRNLGAVALEWCWLAAGRCQLYLHGGQRLWDHAAGRLIATEAGAASLLCAPDGAEPADTLDLAPRVAVAAASDELLQRWLALIDLPLHMSTESD